MRGTADSRPTRVGGTRLALATIRFGPGPGNSTQVSALAQLDGPFPDGAVRALRLPIEGRIGQGGSFAFGTGCTVVSFDYLRTGGLQLGKTRLPVCPIGSAIVSKGPGGAVQTNARISRPVLNGFLGKSPFNLTAAMAEARGERFTLSSLAARLGKSEAPIRFDADRFTGNFAGSRDQRRLQRRQCGRSARSRCASTRAAARGKSISGDISADARLTVSDMAANPRFFPLRSDDVHFTLGDDLVRATGSLRHPGSGTKVSDVNIEHRLSTGNGQALLDVPGLTFNAGLQPDDLTRLTQGVIALVDGTIRGQGRINWTGTGKVTSTGEFTTEGMNLAFPFGPVEGLTGTIRFSDLLAMKTEPGQTFTLKSVNPGILVENGTIRYQLLPGQLVKIERGEWPFMGGTLVLQETILNFNRPTAKRLTFEVIGLDAHTFVSTDGLQGTRRDRHLRRRPADDLRRKWRADRRRPARFAARRRLADVQWRGQQGRPRHDGQYRLQRAARPALPVDGHPPRRRPCRRIRGADGDRRGGDRPVQLDPADHPLAARQIADQAQCEHRRAVPRADRHRQVVPGPAPTARRRPAALA